MPNWNSNNLTIKGKVNEVIDFIKENFRTVKNPYESSRIKYDYILDFEVSQPTPTKYIDNGCVDDWYEWRYKHWGCKWSAGFDQCNTMILTLEKGDDIELIETFYNIEREDRKKFDERLINALIINYENNAMDFDKAELNIFFETPWCPPEGMMRFWFERFKGSSLEFELKYHEPGCCFAGSIEIKQDGNVSDEDNYIETYYSIGSGEIEYRTYLLEEGWEDVESEMEYLIECLEEMHSDMGKEMLDKLIDKVKESLDNAENNNQRAALITDIHNTYRKWRDKEIETVKKI